MENCYKVVENSITNIDKLNLVEIENSRLGIRLVFDKFLFSVQLVLAKF